MKGHCLSEGQKHLCVVLVLPKGVRHNTVFCCVSQSNPSQLLSLLGCYFLVLSIQFLVAKLKRALEKKELWYNCTRPSTSVEWELKDTLRSSCVDDFPLQQERGDKRKSLNTCLTWNMPRAHWLEATSPRSGNIRRTQDISVQIITSSPNHQNAVRCVKCYQKLTDYWFPFSMLKYHSGYKQLKPT